MASLGHPHSRVRLALLSALDSLLSSGAVPQRLVEGVVVPGVRPLAADRAPAVREAFFAGLARWMGAEPASSSPEMASGGGEGLSSSGGGGCVGPATAADRCRLYAPLLLPLLLLGVSDPSELVAAHALSQLEAVGRAWAQGGSGADAAAGAAAASVGEGTGPMQVDGGEAPVPSTAAEDAAASAAAVAAAALPPPYHGLPGAGARAMGAALLPELLPAMLRALGEWTAALRCAAARELHALLVLAGAAATPQLARLVPALCAAVGDEDAEVAARVAACVRALGALAPAARWLPLAADAAADPRASHAARANALVVMAGLADAAGRAGQPLEVGQLAAVAAALGGEDVLASAAEHAGARAQLLSAVRAVLEWAGPAGGAPEVSGPLYRALLQLCSAPESAGPAGAAVAGAALEALPQLEAAVRQHAAAAGAAPAAAGGDACSQASLLCATHGPQLLESLAAGASAWQAESPGLLAFGALLRTAPPPCLAALLPRAVDAMAPAVGDADADPGLRLALLRLLDGLLEVDASGPAFRAPGAAEAVISRLIMPPLAWRAGKVAAAVRFQAVAALATLVRRGLAGEAALRCAVDAGLLPLLHQVRQARGLVTCAATLQIFKTSDWMSRLPGSGPHACSCV